MRSMTAEAVVSVGTEGSGADDGRRDEAIQVRRLVEDEEPDLWLQRGSDVGILDADAPAEPSEALAGDVVDQERRGRHADAVSDRRL